MGLVQAVYGGEKLVVSYPIIECRFLYMGILIRGQVAKVNVIVHGEMDVRCKKGRIRNHYIKRKPIN